LVSAALLNVTAPKRNVSSAGRPIRTDAEFTPAARRAAHRFLAAVGRKDLKGARSLLAPSAPCSRFVVPAGGAFRPRDVVLSVADARPHYLLLDAVIKSGRVSLPFNMGLEWTDHGRWVVDYWDTHYSPQTLLCEAAQTSS
jgi:hypothetical protein